MKIIILGASGYIGLRLSIKLKEKNKEIHLFNRNKKKLKWLESDNVFIYDLEFKKKNKKKLIEVFKNADIVYYLIHSMSEQVKESFSYKDIEIAEFIRNISEEANVKQIVYLGGLGKSNEKLSTHLKSRQDTGLVLSKGKVPVLEYRAGIIIGAGSSSFEIIRTLANKLPFILVPWKEEGLVEPIFIDNVLKYLLIPLNKVKKNEIIEIGCGEQITYAELIKKFAKENLNRDLKIIKIKWLHKIIKPELIGYIISFMTGQHKKLIIPLIHGVSNNAIVTKRENKLIKSPVNLSLALKLAIRRERKGIVISSWEFPSNLSHLEKKERLFFTTKEKEGLLFEENWIDIKNERKVFEEIKKIGGIHGYWSPKILWKIRGLIDRLFGGPGLNLFYKYNNNIHVGSRIDFWIVESLIEKDSFKELRLRSEMKTPGEAWLQFTIEDKKLYLRAFFEPAGILGYIYWYSLYIIHKFIFKEMILNIVKNSKSEK
jgi:uncharacterized protein YbjT (DUF2867 family)